LSWREKHLSDVIQPLALGAPEVTLGAPWDTGVDIWSLGCLVIEFVYGYAPFREDPSEEDTWTAEDDHLAKIVEIIGPIPSSLLKQGRRTAEFFDEQDTSFPPYLSHCHLAVLLTCLKLSRGVSSNSQLGADD
ncbi:hypothetical protein E4U19_004104, partial [Claviceps sp. Clav32 group G5]